MLFVLRRIALDTPEVCGPHYLIDLIMPFVGLAIAAHVQCHCRYPTNVPTEL